MWPHEPRTRCHLREMVAIPDERERGLRISYIIYNSWFLDGSSFEVLNLLSSHDIVV